jgi:serine protease inhibitor
MKSKFLLLTFSILFGGLLSATAALEAAQKLSAANNDFAFKLLKQLAKAAPAQNIFISPYSAATVLQMVGNGAAGSTKMEIQQVLGTAKLPADVANMANQEIAQALNSPDTNVILTTANAIWYRQGTTVKPAFVDCNRQFFGATVDPLDFADPHSVDVINHWAEEKTHGKITRLADKLVNPAVTQLILANAVYFKGKWADPFAAGDTKNQPFYLRTGQKIVPLMHKSKTFSYRRGTGYQAVRLPYRNGHLAMYVFLPDENSSPEKLLSLMSGDVWQRITKPGFGEREGTLELPRFKLEYRVGLKAPLQALGMKTAFGSSADFSGIAPLLYISIILQKTFVEVKEEGTEAAAVTGMEMVMCGPMPAPDPNSFQMIVNRPFLFLIEDNQTGTILFMGTIFDPQAN